ncbi:MAG TPA: hypothetical protein VM324_12540 [Egibacteraceae bacterium]|jgi:hypothetical protein|nr:hypothetical protein [Egibacteraceae bacterium]
MELVPLGDLRLTYTTLESIDYGPDGQLYGTMEGRFQGDRVAGELRLTNLAARRGDNVNLPTLRGVLTTDDNAVVWIEFDGIATLRQSDRARVFTTAVRFRTGTQDYLWLNGVLGVLEGILDTVAVGGIARGRVYACHPTLT